MPPRLISIVGAIRKNMHKTLRQWIVAVLNNHPSITRLALCQRAKFEGWLKFELAAYAESKGATKILLEAPSQFANSQRSDLSFTFQGTVYDVELKTPNTNWRMQGVLNKTRPITKNVASVVADAKKLKKNSQHGLVAFVLFPIPSNDSRWEEYLSRIATDLNREINKDDTCIRVCVQLENQNSADAVVCCFPA